MILVDRALRARADAHNPVRVGMIGAGFMGRAIANQIVNSVPGMTMVAIANRTADQAERAYREAGVSEIRRPTSRGALSQAIANGAAAVTDDAELLCESDGIDAVIEVTGTVEFAAHTTLRAIEHGKHVVLMNAELDATIGPILKTYADREGLVLTAADGDQPGVEMNLYRFVTGIGLRPLVCGNIKGLQDPYRTPTTQESFARKWGQSTQMVTSFADGSKISFEQAVVANGTGMTVAKRGMLGYEHSGHVDDATSRFDVDELEARGGIVDYLVGAQPSPGVFVYATLDDPKQRHYLNLYKLGEGPLYSFYTPYHLCHFEVPASVARAVIYQDAVLAPIAGPVVDVVATAKRDLDEGDVLDGIGRYMLYGQCEKASVTDEQRLLPLGLAEGCRLRRSVPKDEVLRYEDVEIPPGRLSDRLRAEQSERFARVPEVAH